MQTEWDYTNLAEFYIQRPDYSNKAIDTMLKTANLSALCKVCDVGAGVGHLAIPLAKKGCQVVAVEPNDAMRSTGIARTKQDKRIQWFEGTGEMTGQKNSAFDLVTFGSSFNVVDQRKALSETQRILKPRGWFSCMWNHRDLNNPLQHSIEQIIKNHVPDYIYGSRREDQTKVINSSNLFEDVTRIEENIIHEKSVNEVIAAWRSHATLRRQASSTFETIIKEIETLLVQLGEDTLKIPYTTKIWMAQLKI